ncbi:e9imm peptide [Streptomyces sp. NPDC002446]
MADDRMSRDEAVELVRRIIAGDYADDVQLTEWFASLSRDLGCPHISDLIFWPRGGEASAEGVVAQALAYRSIALGP